MRDGVAPLPDGARGRRADDGCAEQQRVHQRSGVNAGARMHHHAGGFIDGDQVRIFVENGERYLFRGGVQGSRPGSRLDVDGLAGSNQIRRAARFAVYADAAVLDPILQTGAAVLGKTLVEHEIQAPSGLLGFQLDL